MKTDGPHLSASGSQVMYLKKRITMRSDGILIQPNATSQPNATYVPTIKAMAALKHLASYLDGTPDHGVLLQATEEGQVLFGFWKDNDFIVDEATVPDVSSRAQFNIEAFSDSSWADCKSTRKSTSSGCIFLNGALVMSICRTQASIALSSCEAELYAANGLMVECIYLFRLCKFLCGDEIDVGSDMVQQKLCMDSSSALALVRRTGTGRLKHIEIKQFYLQNLLRQNVFTIHKIGTKLNPADLNTKRLGCERRHVLSKLMSLFCANEDETMTVQFAKSGRSTWSLEHNVLGLFRWQVQQWVCVCN